MDRREEASIVVKKINEYQDNKIEDAELIKAVCHYFDKLKNQSITQAELKFMKYISNVIGIPHYYDILNKKFGQNTTINACDMTTSSGKRVSTPGCTARSAAVTVRPTGKNLKRNIG